MYKLPHLCKFHAGPIHITAMSSLDLWSRWSDLAEGKMINPTLSKEIFSDNSHDQYDSCITAITSLIKMIQNSEN